MPVAALPTGIDICHESFGDPAAPTVLLMHGLGSQLLVWEEGLCRLLADTGLHVVRYDHRDSGLSTIFGADGPPCGKPYDLGDMADDAVGSDTAVIARASTASHHSSSSSRRSAD
ncbi:MAG: hypothetical protein QF548_08530, partial [Acidimicrobiales bacterium]|nr:hypothetical protein [Acidimicrobiales bacterium]